MHAGIRLTKIILELHYQHIDIERQFSGVASVMQVLFSVI